MKIRDTFNLLNKKQKKKLHDLGRHIYDIYPVFVRILIYDGQGHTL